MVEIVVSPLDHLAFNIARGSALACDLGIVIALCWLFAIRKTEVRRANNILDWLIIFAVQRGVLQAIVQTGEVISVIIAFHIAFHRVQWNRADYGYLVCDKAHRGIFPSIPCHCLAE